MADTNGSSGTMVVKLSWGVTIQLVLLLVAIGIAWGTLTTRLSAVEVLQNSTMGMTTSLLKEMADTKTRIAQLEYEVRYSNRQHDERGRGGAGN